MTTPNQNPHDLNETDGFFWLISILSAIFVAICAYCVYNDNKSDLMTIIGLIVVILYAIAYGKNAGNEAATYFWLGRPTKWYTPIGGYFLKFPFLGGIRRYKIREYVFTIEYSDLTFISLDSAKGKMQAKLKNRRGSFRGLYQIVGDDLTEKRIENEVQLRLNQTAPTALGVSVSLCKIKSGSEYEEATHDQRKVLANSVKNELTDDDGSCCGLELVSISIPTPIMEGDLYKAERKIKEAIKSLQLSEAEGQEWNKFVLTIENDWRRQLGMSATERLSPELIVKIREEALTQYKQMKGLPVQRIEGVEGAKPIIKI